MSGNIYSPMYSKKLMEQFWGSSKLARSEYVKAQRKVNQFYRSLLEHMPMARKTTKGNWKVKRQGKRVVAEHSEGPKVETIVKDAIKRMAAEQETVVAPDAGGTTYAFKEENTKPTYWYDGPQGAGLHVLRTERGNNHDYHVVRAVFINDGLTQCYEIRYPTSGDKMNMEEWTNPSFQRVIE